MSEYSIGEIVYHPRNDEEVEIIGIEDDGHYRVKTVKYGKYLSPGLIESDKEMEEHYIRPNELTKITKLSKILA